MQVIILAAGIGSRFENHNDPKPLLSLANGKTILEHQLDNVSQYARLDHVHLVVGYLQQSIREKFPNLSFVENTQYANTNTAKSLQLALDQIDEEDVLWINGDVVFHPYVLHRLLSFNKTALVVNKGQVGQEEVKYLTDGLGKIVNVSKQLPSAEGEAIGINLFKADDLPLLKENLARCSKNDYFEAGVQHFIDGGGDAWAVLIEETAAVEVDFPEDLEKADQLIMRWGL